MLYGVAEPLPASTSVADPIHPPQNDMLDLAFGLTDT